MDESWKKARQVFAALSIPPVVWLFAFFLIPAGDHLGLQLRLQ